MNLRTLSLLACIIASWLAIPTLVFADDPTLRQPTPVEPSLNWRPAKGSHSHPHQTLEGHWRSANQSKPRDTQQADSFSFSPVPLPGLGLSCRVPGEFERQSALVIASTDLIDNMPQLFVELVKKTSVRVPIIVLVNDFDQYNRATDILRDGMVLDDRVHFINTPHNTMWIRDYGPIVVQEVSGRSAIVDAGYDLGRFDDDNVPFELARLFDVPVVSTPLRIDGGNLLSNGAGLGLTTYQLFFSNPDMIAMNIETGDNDEESMEAALQEAFGFQKVVFLEPLAGEPTGHVDMFATFINKNTVLVGSYDVNVDPENAAILDRNAEKLARIRIGKGFLQVERIPMPSNEDEVWRTFTNVVYANGVLLFPTYENVDPTIQMQAKAIYRELMPAWKIVDVDASRIIESEGALHCMTMNLGPLRLPELPAPDPSLQVPDSENWTARFAIGPRHQSLPLRKPSSHRRAPSQRKKSALLIG